MGGTWKWKTPGALPESDPSQMTKVGVNRPHCQTKKTKKLAGTPVPRKPLKFSVLSAQRALSILSSLMQRYTCAALHNTQNMTLIMEERLYGVYQSMFQADLASTVRHSCIVNGAFRDWCAALAAGAAARGSRGPRSWPVGLAVARWVASPIN